MSYSQGDASHLFPAGMNSADLCPKLARPIWKIICTEVMFKTPRTSWGGRTFRTSERTWSWRDTALFIRLNASRRWRCFSSALDAWAARILEERHNNHTSDSSSMCSLTLPNRGMELNECTWDSVALKTDLSKRGVL